MTEPGICVSSELMGVPSEIQIIPHGRHRTSQGEFFLDGSATKEVLRDFKARASQMVIDYEHQSMGGGVAPAAGWIKRLIDRGEGGLWAEVEWTPRAKRHLVGCEYRYLSPVFLMDEADGRVKRLINAALTNNPAIDGMVPVTGRQGDSSGAGDRKDDAQFSSSRKEEFMQKIMDALGLEGSAGEEGVLAAIGVMRSELDGLGESLTKVRRALGLDPDAGAQELEGTAVAMKKASDEAVSLRQRVKGHEAEELVTMAMREGKVAPSQRDWAMSYALRDAESFRVFVAKAPVLVPLGELPGRSEDNSRRTSCPVQDEVNRALGLSKERFMRFSQKEDR